VRCEADAAATIIHLMNRFGSLGPRAARSGPVAIPLALASLVVIALAWTSWDAGRDHRHTAERTVRDYADFAASLVAANANAALGQTLVYAFYAADLAEREKSPEPITPVALAANPPEAGRCAAAYPAGRWFARLGASEEALESVGPMSPALRAWLAEALQERLRTSPAEARLGTLFPVVEGTRHVIAYRLRRGLDGTFTEAHAIAHCFEARNLVGGDFVEVFDVARHQSALLPPALIGDVPVDSLLSVLVTDPAGVVVYRSPVEYASDFHGTFAGKQGPLDGLTIRVALRPELSARLVAGGIPPSRMPETVGLVLLAGALLAATLVQLRRSLELVRLRERFVADVSHELRTPLQQILLFVQLLRLGHLRDEEERAGSLRVVERETHRLIRLVEGVLTFARPKRVAEMRAPVQTGLAPLMREALAAFRPIAEGKRACLELDVEDEKLVVAAPAEPLRQVLLNLFDNAVKYGPLGQRIRVRVERVGETARITVDDQGPGVPPEERKRVWEPFYRLETASGSGGSGIGLAIVHQLLEETGGRAEIGDAPGGGARLVVELPVVSTLGPEVAHRAPR
jgi:signal transduction histidine kinase